MLKPTNKLLDLPSPTQSDIPRARDELKILAYDLRSAGLTHSAKRIEKILTLMTRRTPLRTTGRKNPKLTPQVKKEILFLAETTDLSLQEIGEQTSQNIGAVSVTINEHLFGERS